MNKAVFLNKLNEKLSIINEEERIDLLNEYAAHIDMKVAEGMTEEEATAGFGDFDELTADLLTAYHVNPEYDKYEDATISSSLRRIGHFFEDALSSLLDMNREEVFHVLTRLVVVGIMTFFIVAGLSIFQGIIESMADIPGSNNVTMVLSAGIAFFFTIVKISVVFYAVYFFLERYVISVEPISRRYQRGQQAEEDKYETGEYDERIHYVKDADISAKKRTSAHRGAHIEQRNTEPLMKLFYLLIKLFVFFVLLLPLILSFVGYIVATTVFIALSVLGWPLIGASMVTAGLSFLHYVIIAFIWKITFKSEVA